ncbi:MAG: hypothetical protein RLP44_02450 [Aggregatilineales bacterium]
MGDDPVVKVDGKAVEWEVFNLHSVKGEPKKRHMVIWTKVEMPVARTVKVKVKIGSIRLSGKVMLFRDDEDDQRYSGVAEF